MVEPLGDWTYTWPFVAAFVVGYLCGAIPFGLLLTRIGGYGDIRNMGSGNIGATNVLRTGNKKLAALTLLMDALKGLLPVAVAKYYLGQDIAVLVAAGAFLGHCFPVWLKFKGGKGVATFLGILLGIAWPVGLVACAVWLAAAYLAKRSSVASLSSAVSAPISAWFLADPQRTELAVFLAVLIFLRHAQNIRRIIKGEEPRIGQK